MQEILSMTCKKCYSKTCKKWFKVFKCPRSNCGTIAKKWGNLPHKCIMCAEEPLYVNHKSYIVHTNLHHGGKIRYSVRCPNIMTCQAFMKPNNILRHYASHGSENKNWTRRTASLGWGRGGWLYWLKWLRWFKVVPFYLSITKL